MELWKNKCGAKYYTQVMLGLPNQKSCRQEMFCKRGVLKNFAKFTGKYLCQELFFNRVAGLRPAKKEIWNRCFPVSFAKFLRTPIL